MAYPRPEGLRCRRASSSGNRSPRTAAIAYGIRTLIFCRIWTLIGVTSQVTRSRQPDHVCDRSPDSVRSDAEIGGFRAHGERGIVKIGHLTLDQEIEGSNPSSPANTTTCCGRTPRTPQPVVVPALPARVWLGSSACLVIRRSRCVLKRSRSAPDSFLEWRLTPHRRCGQWRVVRTRSRTDRVWTRRRPDRAARVRCTLCVSGMLARRMQSPESPRARAVHSAGTRQPGLGEPPESIRGRESEDDEHVSPGFGDLPTRGPPEQVHRGG
jgi:hypothetical protein